MWGKKMISAEAAQQLVQAIQHNDMLQYLYLPDYSRDVKERISSLQAEVNNRRESRECLRKLSISFCS